MFTTLYILTGSVFVVGVGAYVIFCLKLSEDIRSGRILVRVEAEAK